MGQSEKSDAVESKELVEEVKNNPSKAKSKIDKIVKLMESNDKTARTNAAFSFAKIGGESPAEVEPYVDKIAELLDDKHKTARVNAAGALKLIAKEHPEKVEP